MGYFIKGTFYQTIGDNKKKLEMKKFPFELRVSHKIRESGPLYPEVFNSPQSISRIDHGRENDNRHTKYNIHYLARHKVRTSTRDLIREMERFGRMSKHIFILIILVYGVR